MSYFFKTRPVESHFFMQTDRHDEAYIRFSHTCERTLKRECLVVKIFVAVVKCSTMRNTVIV
jgi:Ni,Fe-hydrogenase I cytochrome b subunit